MQDFLRAVQALTERLHTLACDDPELRARLHAVGEQWTALFAEPATPAPTPAPAPVPPPVDKKKLVALKEIGIGGQRPPPPPQPAPTPAPDQVLALIQSRCQLKAEAAYWRANSLRQPPAVEPGRYRPNRERELIEQAQMLPDCFLWMLTIDAKPTEPNLPTFYDEIGGCFEICAQAAERLLAMTDDTRHNRSQCEQLLTQAAAAQSALCAAVLRVNSIPDRDQVALFNWLYTYAKQHSIYIGRHMRRDDLADPAQWTSIQTQLAAQNGNPLSGNGSRRNKQLRQGLNTIRYHLNQRRQEATPDEHHWRRIVATVDDLIQQGIPPSNIELRDLLLPVLDEIPADLSISEPAQQVLDEIDRYLANRTDAPAEEDTTPVLTEEIKAIAHLLKGRSIVLIGGSRRPHAEAALVRTFGLEQVYWLETRPHQSYTEFGPYVARPEVALVLLAIRWSSHGFADVNEFCQRYDKPLVRLPGGYNPTQVAQQIVQQVRLELERRYGDEQ